MAVKIIDNKKSVFENLKKSNSSIKKGNKKNKIPKNNRIKELVFRLCFLKQKILTRR